MKRVNLRIDNVETTSNTDVKFFLKF